MEKEFNVYDFLNLMYRNRYLSSCSQIGNKEAIEEIITTAMKLVATGGDARVVCRFIVRAFWNLDDYAIIEPIFNEYGFDFDWLLLWDTVVVESGFAPKKWLVDKLIALGEDVENQVLGYLNRKGYLNELWKEAECR